MPFDDETNTGTCDWCDIDVDDTQSDTTEDGEVLCMDCYAQYNKDRGLDDEGDPLEEEE
jgi:hypothetical protein